MVYGGEHATLERARAEERQLKRWSREKMASSSIGVHIHPRLIVCTFGLVSIVSGY
jgi:hypothetical protein